MINLLEVLTGSRAHGTFTEESDYDTRRVYVLPTSKIISIGNYQKHIENKETDENSWELAHFIYLALRCNPTIFDVFLAPKINSNEIGEELVSLFPHFLNRKRVYEAYKGFAIGQRKKMISPTTNYFRKPKAASHFLRVLYNGIELLNTGTFTLKIMDTPMGKLVLAAKQDKLLFEEVLDLGDGLIKEIDLAFSNSAIPIEANKEKINEFLLKVRKGYW